jgi:hypothetical protein
MSKQFKGKLCAYCTKETATNGDHVFAREFFLLQDRDNGPKAPACRPCNGEKSLLEHYLTAALPFGGRHAQAVANLQTGVPRRLAKNRKLHIEVVNTSEPAWLRQGAGLFVPTGKFSFDGAKLEELLKYIARGLAWHHWQTYLRPDEYVSVLFLTDTLTAVFQQLVSMWNVAQRVTADLGHGTVQYEGVQAVDPPELTVWSVSMYGGVVLTGEGRTDGTAEASCRWWMITGPPEVGRTIEGLKR